MDCKKTSPSSFSATFRSPASQHTMVRHGISLLVLILAGFSFAQQSWRNAPGLARDTSPVGQSFTFDLNSGPELQAQIDEKPATQVSFSTEGGVPYSQPYDAQRIGSDGMWNLHPVCKNCLISFFRTSFVARYTHDRDFGTLRPRAYT